MRVIRTQAYQGHEVPQQGMYARGLRGALDPDVTKDNPIVVEIPEELPPGWTVQNG